MSFRKTMFMAALPYMLLTLYFAPNSYAKSAAKPGEIASAGHDVVVEMPARLPAAAREPGVALYLHRKNSDGSVYLYVEQANGARLAVFDVTEIEHIKSLGNITLPFNEPFRFAEPAGADAVLLRVQSGKAVAMLDLRKPQKPVLSALPATLQLNRMENLGSDVYMAKASAPMASAVSSTPEDYRIYDMSDARKPVLLATAHQVVDSLKRPETGTLFLLGADGLTVVRHPRDEDQFANWLRQY